MTKPLILVTLTLGSLTLIAPAAMVAQETQRALADRILAGPIDERHSAVQEARALGPENTGPALRAALFAALEREARIAAERYARDERGEEIGNHPSPGLASRLTEVIVELRDPEAIPVLAASLATGATAGMWALADFGEEAAPALLEVARSEDSRPRQVDWTLIALRTMVEERGVRPLSDRTLRRIRDVAMQRLMEQHSGAGLTLRRAIDLAVVLDDGQLRRIVERLASDPAEVRARGLSDPDVIERVQKRARDGLAGVPPRPRRS